MNRKLQFYVNHILNYVYFRILNFQKVLAGVNRFIISHFDENNKILQMYFILFKYIKDVIIIFIF